MIKKVLVPVLAVGMLVALAAPALAFTKKDKLKCPEQSDVISYGWTKAFTDSPEDGPNRQAFHADVAQGGALICASGAGVYSPFNSTAGDIPVTDVHNLAFDYLASSVAGAGQVEIVAVLDNGDVVFMDAAQCAGPSISPTWKIADFTGDVVNNECTLYYNGVTPYTSDGMHSAWQNFAAANSGRSVDYVFIGFFGQPAGNFVVDRITLGDRQYYGAGVQHIKSCTTEASC